MPTRYALIGSGHRAQMYLDAIAGPHADVAELVALLDVNPARREFHRDRIPAFADVVLAGPDELEDVIRVRCRGSSRPGRAAHRARRRRAC